MVSLSQKRGIDCRYQISERNGKEEINGFTFRLFMELIQNENLHDFVNRTLEQIFLITRETKLALAGGPVWEEIYEKDDFS